ncbi:MAG: signal peptidase II [Pseudomonadota bacterium]
MRLLPALAIATPLYAVDQASKWWVLQELNLRALGAVEIGPFLNFVYALNTGVNFGLFASGSPNQQLFLAGFAAAVSLALLIWSARTDRLSIALACGMVVGGALANATDRLTEGGVVDFLNVSCCGIRNPFAFNIADVAIFAGALLLAWLSWSDDHREQGSTSTDRP